MSLHHVQCRVGEYDGSYADKSRRKEVAGTRSMNLIHNNPFRILGLPVTATEREIAKRISDLAIHAEMGTMPSYPSDFSVLSAVERTAEAIKDASNHIEQPEHKLYYAQFWFWNNGDADTQAMKLLQEGSISKAVNIWMQTFEGGKVTKKNFSNMRNLSVLLLAIAGKNGALNKDYLTKGIILAGKTFESQYFAPFSEAIAGTTFPIDPEQLLRLWAEEVLQSFKFALDRPDGIATKELLECFKYFSADIRHFVADKFVLQPLQRVEDEIHEAGVRRTDKPDRAKLFGVDLFNNVKNDLQYLKVILGEENVKFQNTADKLANEILQCAIDFFNISIENNDEVKAAADARKLAEMAKNVAAGERVKSRIDENIDLINKWEHEQTNKERLTVVQEQIDTVFDHIRDLPFIKGLSYYERIRLPGIASEFVENCFQQLKVIGDTLGKHDPYYVQLSSLVASNALGMCVLYVNTTDDPRAVSGIMEQIDALDMEPALRERFATNRSKLERIMMRRGLLQ